jgi:hypothetical protein
MRDSDRQKPVSRRPAGGVHRGNRFLEPPSALPGSQAMTLRGSSPRELVCGETEAPTASGTGFWDGMALPRCSPPVHRASMSAKLIVSAYSPLPSYASSVSRSSLSNDDSRSPNAVLEPNDVE